MYRRIWTAFSLLMVATLVLTSCVAAPAATPAPAQPAAPAATAAPSTTEAPAQPAGGQPVTLLWGFWGSPEEKASHERVAQAFMQTHPNIKIDYFFTPYEDYSTKLKTLWAGGDPTAIPDVFFLWPTPSYAARGVLEDLTPYIQKDNYNLNDYWPNLLASASYQGKIYGFPRDIEAHALYYNKALFDAAGVQYPTDNWTWDDLIAASQKLVKKDPSGRVSQYALGMEGGK
jgi:multiple sugar transport system substrate-binding protein